MGRKTKGSIKLRRFECRFEKQLQPQNYLEPIDQWIVRWVGKFLKQHGSTDKFPPIDELANKIGNVGNGVVVFKQYCSTCHKVNDEGISFGPDLSDVGNKLGKEAILISIIQPDAGISFGYEGEQIDTKDGKTYAGYVSSETEEAIQLTMAGGVNQSIPISNIASRKLLDFSLMTPNLHAVMGEQGLVDVVEYVVSLKNYKTLHENPFQGKNRIRKGGVQLGVSVTLVTLVSSILSVGYTKWF